MVDFQNSDETCATLQLADIGLTLLAPNLWISLFRNRTRIAIKISGRIDFVGIIVTVHQNRGAVKGAIVQTR